MPGEVAPSGPVVLDELVEAGFDLFSAATNHALDYSIAGLRVAMEELDKRRLSYAGIGLNLEDARRPVYRVHPHGTVALLSCATTFGKGQEASAQRPDMPGRPGVNPLRHDRVYEVTAPHLAVVREMASQLGLEAFYKLIVQLGFRFPLTDPSIVPFGDLQFREAASSAVRLTARKKDVDDIARWVREARMTADVVIVSFHSHEIVQNAEVPVEFLPVFARRMIDEGADAVVGHGPHLLRGMEIYAEKPIFYSLGNFIGQNELVPRLPSDSYEMFRADPLDTPSQIYRRRSDDDRKGFPSDERFWESVVPVCRFDGRRLEAIELYPIDLGWREPRHLRGRPRLAEGDRANEILDRFAALSATFGTRIVACPGDPMRRRLLCPKIT